MPKRHANAHNVKKNTIWRKIGDYLLSCLKQFVTAIITLLASVFLSRIGLNLPKAAPPPPPGFLDHPEHYNQTHEWGPFQIIAIIGFVIAALITLKLTWGLIKVIRTKEEIDVSNNSR